MPKHVSKLEQILRENLVALQGRKTNLEMAYIMGFKSESSYKRRLKCPELLSIHEIRKLCDRYGIPVSEFVGDYLLKRDA